MAKPASYYQKMTIQERMQYALDGENSSQNAAAVAPSDAVAHLWDAAATAYHGAYVDASNGPNAWTELRDADKAADKAKAAGQAFQVPLTGPVASAPSDQAIAAQASMPPTGWSSWPTQKKVTVAAGTVGLLGLLAYAVKRILL